MLRHLKTHGIQGHRHSNKCEVCTNLLLVFSLHCACVGRIYGGRTCVLYFILSAIVVEYTVVIISYSAIFMAVKNQNSLRQRELQHHQVANREKDKRLAKTIELVIGFCTIFWVSFGYHIAKNPNKNYGVDYIACVTASFANSAINPIIYF